MICKLKYLSLLGVYILLITGCANVRPWTKQEKALLVASCLASVADVYTTMEVLDNGGYELNPLVGKHPSDGKLITYMVTSQTLFTLLAHYLPDYRSLLLGSKAFVNAGCAMHNLGQD